MQTATLSMGHLFKLLAWVGEGMQHTGALRKRLLDQGNATRNTPYPIHMLTPPCPTPYSRFHFCKYVYRLYEGEKLS